MKVAIGKVFLRIGEAMALGFDAGESKRFRKDLGWGRRTARDEDSAIGDGTLERIRLKAWDLRRNNAVVAGIGDRTASFTVGATGIHPQAMTDDAGWNKAAESFWETVYSPCCDSRGRLSLYDLQWMAVALRPTHGGMYLEMLDNGQVRPIECERIRQPRKAVNSKEYRAGVKVDKVTGIIQGYLVHSRDNNGTFGANHAEQYVEAESILPVINRPWRPDHVREIPELAPVVPTLIDIHEMNTYTLNTAKSQSGYIGFLKKGSGLGLNSSPRGSTAPTIGKRQVFEQDWGQILEGFPGDDLDMKSSPTPGAMHIPYVQMQYGLCASALDFPYEFLTLDFSKANMSRMSSTLLLVNKAIRNRQSWLVNNMLHKLWCWRIAMEMRDGGQLSPAPVDEQGRSQWDRVDWQPPEEPWADRQEAQQSDVLEIQAALTTFSAASKRRGRNFEETLRERAREEQLIDTVAAETGVDRDRLVKMQIPGQTDPRKDEDEKKPAGADNAK